MAKESVKIELKNNSMKYISNIEQLIEVLSKYPKNTRIGFESPDGITDIKIYERNLIGDRDTEKMICVIFAEHDVYKK